MCYGNLKLLKCHIPVMFLHHVLLSSSRQEFLLWRSWCELVEVNVQGSHVAAECENVAEASSPHPGNQCSHCEHCSRWVCHKETQTLVSCVVNGTYVLNNITTHKRFGEMLCVGEHTNVSTSNHRCRVVH